MSDTYCMKRGWMDHDLFKNAEYTEREVWCWIVENAFWKEKVIDIKGSPVKIKRGQLSHSIRFMASKWQWDKSRVNRFLKKLEKRDMIKIKIETGQSIITVCNYEDYQLEPGYERDTEKEKNETGARQERDRSETKKNKDNKDNKVKGKISTLEDFKKSNLNGSIESWFKENAPGVDRFKLREKIVAYCESTGKRYKDYGATMRSWTLKDQSSDEKSKKPKQRSLEEAMTNYEF